MPFWISSLGYTLVPVEAHVTRQKLTIKFEELSAQGYEKIHFLHNCHLSHLLSELHNPTIFTQTNSDYFVSWIPSNTGQKSVSIDYKNKKFVATKNDFLTCDGKEICPTCFFIGEVKSNCEHKPGKRGQKRKRDGRICQCEHSRRPTYGLQGKKPMWCKNCPKKPVEAIDLVHKMCVCGNARPTFGLSRTKKALWCKSCPEKDPDAVDVISKMCVCGNAHPTFGLEGETKALWCANCPEKDPDAVNVKSKNCVCGKAQPVFGLEGQGTMWCKNCPEKPIEAIDIVHRKKCACGKARASFGIEGQKPAWCKNCPRKPIEAINLVNKKCCCEKAQPTFGLERGKALWCKNCPEKDPNAIDVLNKLCVCGTAQPIFALPGKKKAIWCQNCPEKDPHAIDVKNKRCACGNSQATFGLEGQNAIWCFTCPEKDPKAINLKHNMCACGNVRPTFGLKGQKVLWCKSCPEKPLEAVDVVSKMCACGKAQPIFGLEGEKAIWCAHCPEKDINAIDSKHKKCICEKRAYYAQIGSHEEYCALCKRAGMVLKPRKQCSIKKCDNLAIYGTKTRLHCEFHHEPEERNLVERECSLCSLFNVLNEQGICEYCDPTKFKTFVERKELHIRDVLDANDFTGYRHNKIANGTECGKERPDFVWEFETHVVILEVDERQHESYSCVCEQMRMVNISQTFGGLPVFWIRYNPDDFHFADGQKSDIKSHKRETHLVEWLTYAQKNPPTAYIQVIYLFYNKCKERSLPENIQNIIDWERD